MLLSSLADAVQQCGLVSLAEPIDICRSRLEQTDNTVAVAVVGGFKAGKSSFINSLAQASLLPVGAVPVTAIVTRVVTGDELRAWIVPNAGERFEIPLDELAEWVSEERNPKNQKRVAGVEVEALGLSRFPHLAFIDTPGIGSIFAHNTGTSMGYVPRVEAAILTTSCTQPISESDVAFLRQIAAATPRFAVILSKADLLSEWERAKVLDFTIRQLRGAGFDAPVFLWSQNAEFSALREIFVQSFLDRLDCAPGESMIEILGHKARALAREALGMLDAGIAAAKRAAGQRRELLAKIHSLCEGPASVPALIAMRGSQARDRSWDRTLSVLEAARPAVTAELTAELDAHVGTWRGSLSSVAGKYETWIRTELHTRLTALAASRPQLTEPLSEFDKECEKLVTLFQGQLADLVWEALGIQLELVPWEENFIPPGAPDVAISATFMFNFDWLWSVLPSRWVRPMFRHHLRRAVAWETEKNISRLAGQWDAALRSALAQLSDQAQRYVEAQKRTILTCLTDGGGGTGPLETARASIATQLLAEKTQR